MPDMESLASYVGANSQYNVQEEMNKGKNYMVPPPPKPGEYIVCQLCGKIMMPEDFSTNEKIRRYEFKWHVHYECQQRSLDQLDRGIPGLLRERETGANLEDYRRKLSKK